MKFKKGLALFTSAILSLGVLAGCSKPAQEEPQIETVSNDSTVASILNTKLSDNNQEVVNRTSTIQLHASTAGIHLESKIDTQVDDVQYVMIYNPYIFKDSVFGKQALSTGEMGSQIITGANRSGGLGSDIEMPVVFATDELNGDASVEDATRKGQRGGLDPVYAKGDKHEFFTQDTIQNSSRKEKEFECAYVGKNCYVWSADGVLSEKEAEKVAKEFDDHIYEIDTTTFGTARFTDNGGKINLLVHAMDQEGLLGFFSLLDIFATDEVSDEEKDAYLLNTDHAIININANYLDDEKTVYSTVAHEFQHLICASNYFYYSETPTMNLWLNEAMSAYAEEINYPGIKEAGYYNELYYLSDFIRKGQSLYNFNYADDEYIGAYGIVYLFSQYARTLGDDSVFANIHSYWRNSQRSDISEQEALISALPASVVRQINDAYKYSPEISSQFKSPEDEWMSKLTLDFYIETLSMDLANLYDVEKEARLSMLYTEVNPLNIEGGGRVIVAVNNGNFEIPTDAENGLIYIGLDKDFKIVSQLVSTN